MRTSKHYSKCDSWGHILSAWPRDPPSTKTLQFSKDDHTTSTFNKPRAAEDGRSPGVFNAGQRNCNGSPERDLRRRETWKTRWKILLAHVEVPTLLPSWAQRDPWEWHTGQSSSLGQQKSGGDQLLASKPTPLFALHQATWTLGMSAQHITELLGPLTRTLGLGTQTRTHKRARCELWENATGKPVTTSWIEWQRGRGKSDLPQLQSRTQCPQQTKSLGHWVMHPNQDHVLLYKHNFKESPNSWERGFGQN